MPAPPADSPAPPAEPLTAPMCTCVTHEDVPAINHLSMPPDAVGHPLDWEALVCAPCTDRIVTRYALLDLPVSLVVTPL